jgi:hypothetical protein
MKRFRNKQYRIPRNLLLIILLSTLQMFQMFDFIFYLVLLKAKYACVSGLRDIYLTKDVSIPRVGFGTAGLGNSHISAPCDALKAGIRLLDTAQAREWYSESSVGEALKNCFNISDQSPIPIIVTKVHPRSYQ